METRSLVKKYEDLIIEHNKLKHDFSENVIIQSMGDMKDINDKLTVKLDKLNDIIDKIFNYNSSVEVMLNTISKDTDISKYVMKCRIEFVQQVVSNCKKLKSEVCYINYSEMDL